MRPPDPGPRHELSRILRHERPGTDLADVTGQVPPVDGGVAT
jgi:hypothetical protein